jgi:hypothetical protein
MCGRGGKTTVAPAGVRQQGSEGSKKRGRAGKRERRCTEVHLSKHTNIKRPFITRLCCCAVQECQCDYPPLRTCRRCMRMTLATQREIAVRLPQGERACQWCDDGRQAASVAVFSCGCRRSCTRMRERLLAEQGERRLANKEVDALEFRVLLVASE